MKKILSLFIAVVMVASACIFCIPTASAATLDAHNVSVEIPHFSGTAQFQDLSGKAVASKPTMSEVFDEPQTFKEGTGNKTLVLDGVIDDGEWGTPLLTVDSTTAAQMGTSIPSAENTYYWHVSEALTGTGFKAEYGLNFKMWMAWDEAYFYMAAVVEDLDGAYNKFSNENIWNGDTLQVRIDPDGPNSVVGGHGYDASVNAFPWASPTRTGEDPANNASSEIYGGKVLNLGASYIAPSTNNGKPSFFDMSPRYNPRREGVALADGTIDYYITKYDQHDARYDAEETNPFGSVLGCIRPVREVNTVSSKRYLTTYEFAIPWTMMDGSAYEYVYDEVTGTESVNLVMANYTPAAGDEFGMSVALLNAAQGATGDYNSFLTWGSGICGVQMGTDDGTAGGSNSIVLASDELGTTGCEHTFAPATCIDPEVCSKCGYKRLFSVGHDYECVINTELAHGQDGVITATCKTCGDVHVATAYSDNGNVRSVWSGAPNDRQWGSYEHTYVDDEGNIIYNPDGSAKSNLVSYEGEKVFDLSDGEKGTYFQLDDRFSTHSYKYSIRLTGLDETNGGYAGDKLPSETNHYVYGFYNWFGGSHNDGSQIVYGMDYAVGFFPDSMTSTTGKFKITEAIGGVASNVTQKVFAETETIDLGTGWHEYIFVFDNDSNTVWYYMDGELILAAWNEGFNLGKGESETFDLLRIFYTSLMMKDMAVGDKTAFLETVTPTPTNGKVIIDGVEYGSYEAGATVELPVPAIKVNAGAFERFYTYTSDTVTVTRSEYSNANATANGRTYSFTMPAGDVSLTSEYVLVGDVDGDGLIGAKDIKQIKKVSASKANVEGKLYEAADAQLDGVLSSKDCKLIQKITSSSGTVDK